MVRVLDGVTLFVGVMEIVGVGDGFGVLDTDFEDVMLPDFETEPVADTLVDDVVDGLAVTDLLSLMEPVLVRDFDRVAVSEGVVEMLSVADADSDLLPDMDLDGVMDGEGVLDGASADDVTDLVDVKLRVGLAEGVMVREEPLDGVMLIEGDGTIGNAYGERVADGEKFSPKHSLMNAV